MHLSLLHVLVVQAVRFFLIFGCIIGPHPVLFDLLGRSYVMFN